jgi:hypothetical protein
VLINLPLKSLDQLTLGARRREIGQSAGGGEPPAGCGMKTMDVIIYHNPRCGTSRNTLGLIRNAGIEPHVIEYLKTPPARALIRQLATRAGVPLRALLRDTEPVFRELGLSDNNLAEDAVP